jgi:metal transporter CNNM
VLGSAKILVLIFAQVPFVQAAPFGLSNLVYATDEKTPKSPQNASLWLYLGVAAALVLLGGAFAGLTIALMGQVRDINVCTV